MEKPLWRNIYIKVKKQSIYYSHLSRIGINFIKDVVNYKGHLKLNREILSADKYNKFVMSINALLQAIPKKWLQIIYNNVDKDLLNSCTDDVCIIASGDKHFMLEWKTLNLVKYII